MAVVAEEPTRDALSEPLLRCREITLRFGGVAALSEVSFTVEPGELFAVIGPNGAGKTSIFNCLNGVYRPQRGSILLDDVELAGHRPARAARHGVARTFQNLALFENLDVVDNLMLGRHHLMRTGFAAGLAWLGRAKREEISHRRRCEEILEFLELGRHRGIPVGVLPYGIQKRIELGRALATEPRLLLLDEPVAGMNVEEAEDMARYVLEIKQDLGIAQILVEHDMHMVMDIADRVMVLDFGRVIATGSPEEIMRDERVIDAYLGNV